jgi:hypothetical protein
MILVAPIRSFAIGGSRKERSGGIGQIASRKIGTHKRGGMSDKSEAMGRALKRKRHRELKLKSKAEIRRIKYGEYTWTEICPNLDNRMRHERT